MRTSEPLEKIITTRDVAQRLGVSRRRVLALIQRGRLPARRLGAQWVIEESALEAVRDRRPGRPRVRRRDDDGQGDGEQA